LAFVAPLHLQENRCKPHRINVFPATPPRVVILAQPESPYLPLLRRCTFRRTDASRTESMFFPQLATNESFAGATPAKASFSPITLMFGIFYPQLPCNQSFGQPLAAQPIDSKPLAPKCFIIYLFPVATT
jgi:hypothetical protein